MKYFIAIVLLCALTALPARIASAAESPFKVSASIKGNGDGRLLLAVAFEIREGCHLYADSISAAVGDVELTPVSMPLPKKEFDKFQEKEVPIYEGTLSLKYPLEHAGKEPLHVTINYMGCCEAVCYPPASTDFTLEIPTGAATVEGSTSIAVPDRNTTASGAISFEGFKVAAQEVGYMSKARFFGLLDAAEGVAGASSTQASLMKRLTESSAALAVLMILLGGLALNLTPCVLPMIPVNIAIIGAGARGGSRLRGFMLGLVYGGGIAAAYGLLGLAFVRTGATFGTIQSSPAFNFAIAGLFAVLSLAMFGVFTIDFTHLQGGLAEKLPQGGGFVVVFIMGLISAILAGACVAPVVIAVLVYSTSLYSAGKDFAQFIPFLLGVGMAIPWPIAGAGLAFLPKPGKWMERVKYGFGVLILAFALYYGWEGWKLTGTHASAEDHEGWMTSLPDALLLARQENKPVLVDFWAIWCKSCIAMDQTTFKDPEVRKRLEKYVAVKFVANEPRNPAVKPVLEQLGVGGFPTYIVLKPEPASE